MQITKGNVPGYWKTEIKIAKMRSKFFANEFAHIHGLQSETGTPARNALSEHYPTTGLKIPLTAFVLDTSGRGFDQWTKNTIFVLYEKYGYRYYTNIIQ